MTANSRRTRSWAYWSRKPRVACAWRRATVKPNPSQDQATKPVEHKLSWLSPWLWVKRKSQARLSQCPPNQSSTRRSNNSNNNAFSSSAIRPVAWVYRRWINKKIKLTASLSKKRSPNWACRPPRMMTANYEVAGLSANLTATCEIFVRLEARSTPREAWPNLSVMRLISTLKASALNTAVCQSLFLPEPRTKVRAVSIHIESKAN